MNLKNELIIFSLFILSFIPLSKEELIHLKFKEILKLKNINSPEEYFSNYLDNNLYTQVIINDIPIDFHISTIRFPSYIMNTTKNYPALGQIEDPTKLDRYYFTYLGIEKSFLKVSKLSLDKKLLDNFKFIIPEDLTKGSKEYIRSIGFIREDAELGFNVMGNSKEKTNDFNDNINQQLNYGMQEGSEIEHEMNFIKQLKNNKIIEDYSFTIKYKENKDEGEIIIGGMPHEYDSNNYNYDYLFYDTSYIPDRPCWGFLYNYLKYDNKTIQSIHYVKLSIEFGFIGAPTNVEESLKKSFFSQQPDCSYGTIESYRFYYCKSEKSVKNFKSLQFTLMSKYSSSNLTKTIIEFDSYDLFLKNPLNSKDNNYYFQVVFNEKAYSEWIFGKPFFKKYQTIMDQDKKIWGFYIDKKGTPKNIEIHYTWFIILILFIALIGLGYMYKKKIIKIPRRNKANELTDTFVYDNIENCKKKNIEMKDNLMN